MADPAYIDADGVLTDGEAWVGIATTTLGVDTASVTFTSPDDGSSTDWSQFMDLILIAYAKGETVAVYDNGLMRLGTGGGAVDTGSNYPYQRFSGDGATASAASATHTGWYFRTLGTGSAANEFAAVVVHMFDINSGKYKSALNLVAADSDGAGFVRLSGDTWTNQGAITSMELTPGTGDFLAGSMFSLFGILPRMVA
jgi:hypothetical protein